MLAAEPSNVLGNLYGTWHETGYGTWYGTRYGTQYGLDMELGMDSISLVLRPLPQKAERGSGVLSDISCHMGRGRMA